MSNVMKAVNSLNTMVNGMSAAKLLPPTPLSTPLQTPSQTPVMKSQKRSIAFNLPKAPANPDDALSVARREISTVELDAVLPYETALYCVSLARADVTPLSINCTLICPSGELDESDGFLIHMVTEINTGEFVVKVSNTSNQVRPMRMSYIVTF